MATKNDQTTETEPTDPDQEAVEAELVPAVAASADVDRITTPYEVAKYLGSTQAVEEEDPEQAAWEIVNRILQAETAEDVLRRQVVVAAEDVLSRPIVVGRVRWLRSDFDSREGVYALIEAADVYTGESMLITCGGRTPMAQLWKLGELGAFPARMQFGKASKATKSGYFPLWLEPAPE